MTAKNKYSQQDNLDPTKNLDELLVDLWRIQAEIESLGVSLHHCDRELQLSTHRIPLQKPPRARIIMYFPALPEVVCGLSDAS